MKIQIIGYSGCGKSTLAKKLSDFYHIPCLYMDCVQFYGDWQERSLEQQNIIVRRFLKEHDDWIIDGNYGHVAPERFEQSDMTIFLDYSRWFCYRMCKQRYKENKGKSRESNPCIEKFDFEFQKWILWDGRTSKFRQSHQRHLKQTRGQSLHFKNRKQLDQWLISIGYQDK